MRQRPSRTPFVCPVCNEQLSPNAKACPNCGACHRSGWSQDTAYDGLGIDDDGFDYNKFIVGEFGGKPRVKSRREIMIWVISAILLAAFVCMIVSGKF